eukprot:349878-Chlamydomonas_euryale.AAC.5
MGPTSSNVNPRPSYAFSSSDAVGCGSSSFHSQSGYSESGSNGGSSCPLSSPHPVAWVIDMSPVLRGPANHGGRNARRRDNAIGAPETRLRQCMFPVEPRLSEGAGGGSSSGGGGNSGGRLSGRLRSPLHSPELRSAMNQRPPSANTRHAQACCMNHNHQLLPHDTVVERAARLATQATPSTPAIPMPLGWAFVTHPCLAGLSCQEAAARAVAALPKRQAARAPGVAATS